MARTQPTNKAGQTDPIRKSHLSNLLGLSSQTEIDQLLKAIDKDREIFEHNQQAEARQKSEDEAIRSTMRVLHPTPTKYQNTPASTSYNKEQPRNLPAGNAAYENSTMRPWILAISAVTEYFTTYKRLPNSIYVADGRIKDLIKDTAYCTNKAPQGCVFEYPQGDGESYAVIPVRSDNLLKNKLNDWTILCSNHL